MVNLGRARQFATTGPLRFMFGCRSNGPQQARKAVKADVQAWNRHLLQELDDATAARGHKTAWSVCPSSCWRDNRQRTSRYPNRLGSSISAKYNWPLKQLNQCQAPSGLNYESLPGSFHPLFSGDAGRQLQAVCPEARPHHGALPVGIWSLLGHGNVQPGQLRRARLSSS